MVKEIWYFIVTNNDDPLTPSLPNIDVTLVGNRQNNFSILYDLKIERDDIINYISLIETTICPKTLSLC